MIDFYISMLLAGVFFFGSFLISESLLKKVQLTATVSQLERVRWVGGDEAKTLTTLKQKTLAPQDMHWDETDKRFVAAVPFTSVDKNELKTFRKFAFPGLSEKRTDDH